MRKYKHHKYTWTHPFSSTRHNWEFVGPNGAVNFHVSIMDEIEKYPDPSCGLEFHHLIGSGAPDHVNCPLTGGRCWHDGTSLYASETVWPMVKGMLQMGDHAAVFRYLERIADDHFDRNDE